MVALKLHWVFTQLVLLTCFYAGLPVHGGKILINPLDGAGSHYFTVTSIGKELVKRGHNVTVLVDDRFEDKLKGKGQFELFNFEIFKSNFTLGEYNSLMNNLTDAGLKGEYIKWMMELLSTDFVQRQVSECDNLLGNEELITNLRNANFDLVIVDLSNNCPVMQYLGKPYVIFLPALTVAFGISLESRSPFNPSYMPEFATALDHNMSFLERFKNAAYAIFFTAIVSVISNPYDEIKQKYDLADKPSFYAGAVGWAVSTNFAFDYPRPLLPNTVTVGGLTTAEAKPLNHEWEEFLQSAGDDGVVLFSMGTYATGIDENIAGLFARTFAQLPQKVIWKLNGKPSAKLTPNVKVADWIPQNDLLGHPQVKVLVYHCGLNGIWEAVFHGVPIVAVPLFADQFDNAQRIVSRGMGVKVDIATLTSDELAQAIRTVINDPSYKENATRISTIFRDTPRKPVEKAADWLEYIIRHGGAKHLRSAALDLNIFQYLLLDVIAVLLLAVITFITIAICCCRLCFRGCRKLCGRSSKVKSE